MLQNFLTLSKQGIHSWLKQHRMVKTTESLMTLFMHTKIPKHKMQLLTLKIKAV